MNTPNPIPLVPSCSQVRLQEQLSGAAEAADRAAALEEEVSALQAEIEAMKRSSALSAAARNGRTGVIDPETQRLISEEAAAREKVWVEKAAAAESR